MTNENWIHKWSRAVGIEPLASDPDDLVGLFQRFRPDGRGVEALFLGVSKGDRVLARLRRVFSCTASDYSPQQAYFVVSSKGIPPADAVRMAQAHLERVEALTSDDPELVEVLRGLTADWSADLDDLAGPSGDDDPAVWLFDAVSDVLRDALDQGSPLGLLWPAAYSMANDLYLAAYVLWPLYEKAIRIDDAFLPYFELWSAGLHLRFTDETHYLVGPNS